jgi:SNF2 family DNA or RNA helicase
VDEALQERVVRDVHDCKLNALVDLSEELSGKPVLVFYQFRHDLDNIRKRFPGVACINGDTPPKASEIILEQWNAGALRMLCCQSQSVSHGLNMQGACNDVAWYGLCDSPETYDQCFRRVYRQGVKGEQVRIHRILMRGTVDETIKERIEGKFQTQEQFLEAQKKHARSK